MLKKVIRGKSVINVFILGSALFVSCDSGVEKNRNEVDTVISDAIVHEVDTLSFNGKVYVKEDVRNDACYLATKNDSVYALIVGSSSKGDCYREFPVGYLGDSQKLWVSMDNDCGVWVSNQLIIGVKTVLFDSVNQEVVYTFYQELGRSHNTGPTSSRYVVYSEGRGKLGVIVLEGKSEDWPYW